MNCESTVTAQPNSEIEQAQARLLARRLSEGVNVQEPDNRPVHKPTSQPTDLQRYIADHAAGHSPAGQLGSVIARTVANHQPAQTTDNAVNRPVIESLPQHTSQPANDENRAAVDGGSIGIVGDFLAAGLQLRKTAQMRLYLALRLIDTAGTGLIYRDDAKSRLNGHINKRYLNRLLADGNGLFWDLGEAHKRPVIRLRGVSRIYSDIATEKATGRAVAVRWSDLFGTNRNHFRQRAYDLARQSIFPHARPVTRRTIHSRIGVGKSTQRRYDKANSTYVKQNIVLGYEYSEINMQRAQRDGRACFELNDRGNKAGRNRHESTRNYVAWWQGNTYQPAIPANEAKRKKRRRLNRDLTRLWVKVTEGHVSDDSGKYERLFFDDASSAGAAYNRDVTRDAIYPSGQSYGYGFYQQFNGMDRSMLAMLQD